MTPSQYDYNRLYSQPKVKIYRPPVKKSSIPNGWIPDKIGYMRCESTQRNRFIAYRQQIKEQLREKWDMLNQLKSESIVHIQLISRDNKTWNLMVRTKKQLHFI